MSSRCTLWDRPPGPALRACCTKDSCLGEFPYLHLPYVSRGQLGLVPQGILYLRSSGPNSGRVCRAGIGLGWHLKPCACCALLCRFLAMQWTGRFPVPTKSLAGFAGKPLPQPARPLLSSNGLHNKCGAGNWLCISYTRLGHWSCVTHHSPGNTGGLSYLPFRTTFNLQKSTSPLAPSHPHNGATGSRFQLSVWPSMDSIPGK